MGRGVGYFSKQLFVLCVLKALEASISKEGSVAGS